MHIVLPSRLTLIYCNRCIGLNDSRIKFLSKFQKFWKLKNLYKFPCYSLYLENGISDRGLEFI